VRDRVRVYQSPGGRTPEEMAERANSQQESDEPASEPAPGHSRTPSA
jgi:hypothetical protein